MIRCVAALEVGRAHERHRPALDEEPAGLPREVPDVVVAVLQGDALGTPADDVAAEVARAILDEEAHLDDDIGVRRTTPLRFEVVEDVGGVRHLPSEAVGSPTMMASVHVVPDTSWT